MYAYIIVSYGIIEEKNKMLNGFIQYIYYSQTHTYTMYISFVKLYQNQKIINIFDSTNFLYFIYILCTHHSIIGIIEEKNKMLNGEKGKNYQYHV